MSCIIFHHVFFHSVFPIYILCACFYMYALCVHTKKQQKKSKRNIKNEKAAKVNIVYVPSSLNMFAAHLVAVLLRSVSPLYQLYSTASVGGEAAAGRVEFFSFHSILHVTFFYIKLCSSALFYSSVAFFVWLAGSCAFFS